jgi:hypothetical protein
LGLKLLDGLPEFLQGAGLERLLQLLAFGAIAAGLQQGQGGLLLQHLALHAGACPVQVVDRLVNPGLAGHPDPRLPGA